MEQITELNRTDTIAAISTPPGKGGIAVIRISGPRAVEIAEKAWRGKKLSDMESHKASLGKYVGTNGEILDEAVATVFKGPHSFTGEDVVELSVHGSTLIQREILSDLIRNGARTADHGEFSQRAFMNGRIDLAQAEGIADLIASSSRAAHHLAMTQTRGLFSKEFDRLRDKLIEFASLLELELDFSEEDVEFADRGKLLDLARTILDRVTKLEASYSSGAVIKDGLPVVIAGVPNAGKSSLLNLLLGDEKAIVTDIPGTTRDFIEDTVEINGILYRFIDTAGLRESTDAVEAIGINRARSKMRDARIIIWIMDPTLPLSPQIDELESFRSTANPVTKIITLLNKADLLPRLQQQKPDNSTAAGTVAIGHNGNQMSDNPSYDGLSDMKLKNPIIFSVKTHTGITELQDKLQEYATSGLNPDQDIIITNARHYEALRRGRESMLQAIEGITSALPADLIAQDIRETIHHLGTITGSVTTADLLHSIFSRFCIGK